MAIPINPGKIKKAAEEVQFNVDMEVHVNCYYDKTSNADLLSSFRDYLNEADNSVYLNFIDISDNNIHLDLMPDFAVIFAGDAVLTVSTYDALTSNDIPALIVAIDPYSIVEYADQQLISIRKSDFICPDYSTYSWTDDTENSSLDFSQYNQDMDLSLKSKFIDWMYIYSEASQIAYAAKFPFLRRPISNRVVNATSIENAGVGAIKIIPGADMPLMTLNQARMLLELAAIYNYDVNADRIVEIVALVLSAFGFKSLSKYVHKATPIPSFVIDAVFGFGGTMLLGRVAKEYFASGLAPEGLVDKVKSLFK